MTWNSVRALVLAAAITLLPAAAQAQAIQAWVQLSAPNPDNPSVGLALDASGDVVVDGAYREVTTNPMDWLITKYSSAGVPLWTNRYDGPENGWDQPGRPAVDASGNVYVAGSSGGANGWPDYATIKYSSDGIPLWTNYYDGPISGGDQAYAIAFDTNGNVYVTGRSEIGRYDDPYTGPWGTNDCVTIKYSSTGVPLWTNRYYRPGDGEDVGIGVSVDASGNVSVFACFYLPGDTSCAFAKITYSSAGARLEVKSYGSFGDWPHYVQDLSGNLIITSRDTQYDMYGDYKTVKYSSAGSPLWTRRYNGQPAKNYENPIATAVDAGGNVVVTGSSANNGTHLDYATIKYSSTGVPLWTNRYTGPVHDSEARGLALDSSGNVFVTGYCHYNLATYAIATLGYSSSGIPLFTNLYVGPGNMGATPSSLAVDASGNVYVAGSAKTSDSTGSFVTIKYVIPPIITRQPVSCTNAVGTTASFTVDAWGAAGAPLLSYQWRRAGTNLLDGGNLSGVTTTKLQIANVHSADAGSYTVVITNAYGSATSSVAQLTVISPGRFSSLSYSPETGFSFIFRDGTVGRPYRIQRSPSMAQDSWADWQSFTYTEPILLTDMGATGAERRFYRAISP